jgi:hypothetical protein
MVLRRIGMASLCVDGVELPPYYDPQYDCEMEVLAFDSRFPNPKYREWVAQISASLTDGPVICPERDRSMAREMPRGFEIPDGGVVPSLMPAWMS